MNRCPITYEPCGDEKYSKKGLKLLSPKLKALQDFPFTSKEQIQIASRLAAKLSIQGVQPKLSAILNIRDEKFEIAEKRGRFILKPPHHIYDELPQNEDLTMKLAALVGIEVPLHGMIYNIDNSLSYFIKRFDRLGKGKKARTEDFSPLVGFSRETKYDSSMEEVAKVINMYCAFPNLEKIKLFRRVLFSFLVGNEDMHVKNFTLIERENKIELSPAYDLLNTSIVIKSKEEIALPIKGKKSNLKRSDLVDYFGIERLKIPANIIEEELRKFQAALEPWKKLIEESFLSKKMQDSYWKIIENRWNRIFKENR